MNMVAPPAATAPRRPWVSYRSIWRWHFYAGLFCVPFVILLAITGSIYLFKPQVEAWLDRPYDRIALAGPPATADAQVAAALAAVPGATFKAYEIRERANDATRVIVGARDGDVRVFVHPGSARVLKVEREDRRLMEVIKTIHGELLLGDRGSILVELAASWAIVMIVTGLYLWWPRRARGLAGVLYPRIGQTGRVFWRDLHAVTGIWVSSLALFLLLSGLPWTTVWGAAFKEVRAVTGTAAAKQDWSQGRRGEHAGHATKTDGMGGMSLSGTDHLDLAATPNVASLPSLNTMVVSVRALDLAPPVLLAPPAKKAAWNASKSWTARSDAQDRPLRVTLTLDPATGAVLSREDFASKHVIDRIVGYGIAAHEGQLFGLANQLLGVSRRSV